MGGKGRRRREKNYRAAHGGSNVLPPPPDPSMVDALPSKLRRIISFTSSSQPDIKQQKTHEGDNAQALKDKVQVNPRDTRPEGTDAQLQAPHHKDNNDEQIGRSSTIEKNKKKRKRKEVKDLRFEMEVEKTRSRIKRRERKKKYLEAKKKNKKNNTEEQDFPGHENIKFGDIVEGPPKLNVIPKAFKNPQDASQERLRLKAIEQYRSRKGWVSRPGSHLPPPVTASTL
ncbi:protein PXR1-like [Neltuma alba]|uniref:protein PXR1-like n=1 Tax=Neltuma alba TaxID=207710 RepID=UPI0010A4E21E|nr:protein PXR1-like [Prosopis alba]XP_028801181.1 protein PXR1-like [Prosopis alba]